MRKKATLRGFRALFTGVMLSLLPCTALLAQDGGDEGTVTLSKEVLMDKIKGGLFETLVKARSAARKAIAGMCFLIGIILSRRTVSRGRGNRAPCLSGGLAPPVPVLCGRKLILTLKNRPSDRIRFFRRFSCEFQTLRVY